MRQLKSNIIAILALMVSSTFAQITLEETYTGSAGLSQVTENEFHYYYFDANTLNCEVSDFNHTSVNSIPIPLDTDETLSTITYLSKDLFDTDDELELVFTYSYWYQIDTSWYLSYSSKVINEDGNVLLEIPGAQYLDIINTVNGSKLMSWIYDFSLSSYPIETKIYNLPGQYNNINEGMTKEDEFQAYPNPCRQQVYLPLLEEVHSVQILNSNGQIVDEIKDKNQTILQYQVNNLSPGVYFARQTTLTGDVFNQKFVIH